MLVSFRSLEAFHRENVRTLDDGHDGALLDSRRALETVGVDTTEKLGLQVHRIERVGGLIVVGLNLSYSAHNR